MANEFDPYREALVVENLTVWPDEYDAWNDGEKARVAQRLHSAPQEAAELTYERQHTGFSRIIKVTAEDVARVK